MFMKMQNLFVLIALLLFCTSPTETKVVRSMADCSQFFLNGSSPNIPGILEEGNILDQNRYKTICQTLKGETTFVTLYDTKNKIPVFSASKYRGHAGNRPRNPIWNIETQLEDSDNMQPADQYRFQAGARDYQNNQGFDKGHLLPSSYGHTQNENNSTFTLTNIVPQVRAFNQGSWNNMEQCVKCVLDKYCINNNKQLEGYVVIGAQPSENNTLNNETNSPSFLWSAFCCYSTRTTENKWLASAHWGENVVEPAKKYLKTITLKALYEKLGGQFNVFPETQCPLDTTVTGLYPSLNQECNCPPITPTGPPATTAKGTTLKPTSPTTTAAQAAEESSTKPSSSLPHWNEEDDYTDYFEDAAAFKFMFEKTKRIPSRYLPRVHPGSPEMATTRHLNRCRNCFRRFKQSLDRLSLCLRLSKCITDSKNAYRYFRRSNLHFPQIDDD